MTQSEYEKAANYWKRKDASSVNIDRDELMSLIEDYVTANNTCALATGTGDFVRCTPIEYSYHDGAFFMFSEGGEKFIALEKNKNVCLAIYDKYGGFGTLKGMQIKGIVNMIEPFSDEYITAAEFKKIPIETLKKLKDPMNLIKVTPIKIDFLNSDFKKEGYSSRQSIELD